MGTLQLYAPTTATVHQLMYCSVLVCIFYLLKFIFKLLT